MKTKGLSVLLVLAFICVGTLAFAGGDKNHGDKGQGEVHQENDNKQDNQN
jgi:hypothetical protein